MRCKPASLALATTLALSAPALADEARPRNPSSESYALPLGLSYLVMPALAGGAAGLFPDLDAQHAAAVGVGVVVLGLAAPAAVHFANGERLRGITSPIGTVATTLVLGLAGLGFGSVLANSQCGSDESESTSYCRLPYVILPTYLGAGIGYLGWAIYDTAARSSVEREPQLTLVPAVSKQSAAIELRASF